MYKTQTALFFDAIWADEALRSQVLGRVRAAMSRDASYHAIDQMLIDLGCVSPDRFPGIDVELVEIRPLADFLCSDIGDVVQQREQVEEGLTLL